MTFWRVSVGDFDTMDIEGPTVMDAIADATEQGAKLEDIHSVVKISATKYCLHNDDAQPADPRGCALCQGDI